MYTNLSQKSTAGSRHVDNRKTELMDFLSGLNPNQKEAALSKEGPILVIAGAGAGKTRTLTSRVCALIRNGVFPEHILAVTFTNRAASEMRDRIRKILGSRKSSPSPFF